MTNLYLDEKGNNQHTGEDDNDGDDEDDDYGDGDEKNVISNDRLIILLNRKSEESDGWEY